MKLLKQCLLLVLSCNATLLYGSQHAADSIAKEEDMRERFARLQAEQEQGKKTTQSQENLPRVGSVESVNICLAGLRKSKL